VSSARLQFDGLEKAVLPPRPLHLAIGMFDGVHLGHRAVIDMAIQSARRSHGVAAVLTFWPHPSALFRPHEATKLIMGPEQKAKLLAAAGVDAVITQHFTPEFAQIEAEAFVPLLQKFLPRLSAIYVGDNWRFGRGRRGDIDLLVAEGRKHGLAVVSAQRINHNGEPISSTRIRANLETGAIEEANALLGYTYFSEGVVTPGKGLGRKLAFPTLNLAWEPELRPRFGVYVTEVARAGEEKKYPAVSNYGLRPTVEQTTVPRLETHVLGECPLGVGDVIQVDWLKFLRPEMKFSGVDALTAQIAQDRAAAAAYFAAPT
jgi:riboflavin kinase / FMN adenylyltransferase